MSILEINTITSKLNPNITYEYGRKVNKNDKNKSGTVETITFAGKTLNIALGVAHPIYSNSGALKTLIYYNIYLVDIKSMKVERKIGVYEIPSTKLMDVYDNREVQLSKLGKPLFFPSEFEKLFPGVSYNEAHGITKTDSVTENTSDSNNTDANTDDDVISIESYDDDDNDDEEDEKTETTISEIETDDEEDEDDDEDEDEIEDDKPLQIETADENAKIIEEYTPNDEDNWIQRKFKNKNYKIMPSNNEKSLFEAVKQSFDDESTSVSQIREIVSKHITIDEFLKYRNIYDNLIKQKEDVNKKIQENLDSQEKTLPTMNKSQQLQIASSEDNRKKNIQN